MNINEPTTGGFILPFHNRRSRRSGSKARSFRSNRLSFLNWLPDEARNHFVATSAEFTGTTLFLFFAFSGTQVALLGSPDSNSNQFRGLSHPDQVHCIDLWILVTLGMYLVGALGYLRGLFLFIAQVLGGITAAVIVSALFPGPLTVQTSLGGGTSVVQGLFIEMVLSAELVFTIFMLAAEKHKGTFIAPFGIGPSLFVTELTGVYFAGGSVNPARSFGPAVVTHHFATYHWIYWIGPILGTLLAAGFYKFIKMLEYETANPGADFSKEEEQEQANKNQNENENRNEHFNPDNDHTDPNVAFAPEQYAMSDSAMENGQAGSGGHGVRRGYGIQRKGFPASPERPRRNHTMDLTDEGVHVDEFSGTLAGRGEPDQRGMKPTMGKVSVPSAGVAAHEMSKTQVNRNMNSGIPRDEEFFDR